MRNNSDTQRSSFLEVQIKVFCIITSRNSLGKLENTLLSFFRSVSIQMYTWKSSLPAHWQELIHQKDSPQCPGESPAPGQLQLRKSRAVIRWYWTQAKPASWNCICLLKLIWNIKFMKYYYKIKVSLSCTWCNYASSQHFNLASRASSAGCAIGYNWSNSKTQFTLIYRRGVCSNFVF